MDENINSDTLLNQTFLKDLKKKIVIIQLVMQYFEYLISDEDIS